MSNTMNIVSSMDTNGLVQWWVYTYVFPVAPFTNSMDKKLHLLYYVGWNYFSIPKLQLRNHWSLGMDK